MSGFGFQPEGSSFEIRLYQILIVCETFISAQNSLNFQSNLN